MGRTIGYPTANIPIPGDFLNGVWAGRVKFQRRWYDALISIGCRSSVDTNSETVLEAHLFDFSGDLYGKMIAVELLRFMRPQQQFDSIEELRAAISRDEQTMRAI